MCFQAKSPSEKSRDQGEKKCWKRETKREKRKEKVLYVENPRSRFRTTSECVPEGPLTPLVKSPASSKGKIPRLDLAYFYAGEGSTMTSKRLSFQE